MAGGANPAMTRAPSPLPSQVSPAAANNVFQQSSSALTDAMGGARAAMQYQPQNVEARSVQEQFGYDPRMVAEQFGYDPMNVAAQTAAGGISTYMNPYTQQVIDTSLQDIERQRQMAANQLGAQASAAGAFGGSRQGVAESLTNAEFARQAAQTAAGLRQQGFQTALGAAQQDVATGLQAALANQAARARASEFAQQTGLQAALANQAAQSRATEFGQNLGLQAQTTNVGNALQAALANQSAGLQGAQLRLSGAGQLGNLSQTGFGMGRDIIGMQQEQGRLQQATNQALIDRARQQYSGFANAPQTSLQLPMAAVGAANMGQQSTTASRQPGLFDYLSLGLGIM